MEEQPILAPEHVKENAFTTLEDGRVAIRSGGVLTPVAKLSEDGARRVRGLIRLRDAVRDTLRTQLDGAEESGVLLARRRLNERYDQFVARLWSGQRSGQRAGVPRWTRTFHCCVRWRITTRRTKQAAKTAIFTERTIHQFQTTPRAAESAQDALVLTLNATGRVDLEYMEGLLGRPSEAFLPELKGLLYPQSSDRSLGNRRPISRGATCARNSHAAQTAATADPAYRENVVALEAVQPEDLSASEIGRARLGAVWIPPKDIEEFANAIVPDGGAITVSHAPQVGSMVRGGWLRGAFLGRQHDGLGNHTLPRPGPDPGRAQLENSHRVRQRSVDGEAGRQRAGDGSRPGQT